MLYFVLQLSTVRAAGQSRRIRAVCFGLSGRLPANRHYPMQEGRRWGPSHSPRRLEAQEPGGAVRVKQESVDGRQNHGVDYTHAVFLFIHVFTVDDNP